MPTMWSDERLVSIYGTTVFDDVVLMRKQWISDAIALNANVEETMWARATLQGRAISLKKDEMTAFVPFMQFANHDDEPDENAYYPFPEIGNNVDHPDTTILLRSRRSYAAGEEITISYGDLSFQQKCTCFGWVDPTLRKEAICISAVSIPNTSRSVEIKTSMIDAQSFVNGKELGSEQLLRAKKAVKETIRKLVKEGLTAPQSKRHIGQTFQRKIEVLSAGDDADENNDSDCKHIRKIELNAARLILSVLVDA